MRNLSIIQDFFDREIDLPVGELQADSRCITEGDVFVAMKGQLQDGRRYIEKAVELGARAVIYENGDGFVFSSDSVVSLGVAGLSEKIPEMASRFYGEPSRAIKVIGVTGTNGKSSVTNYIAQLLAGSGHRCAIIGTVGSGFIDDLKPALNTTPGPIELQKLLAGFVEAGAEFVAMEVSSHGIAQGRINGVHFFSTMFTNLSRDHLDFHKTMEAYFAVKENFILANSDKTVVLNYDDSMIRNELLPKLDRNNVITVGMDDGADIVISAPVATDSGTSFKLREGKSGEQQLSVPLIGLFNVYNAVMAKAMVDRLVGNKDLSLKKLGCLRPLIGRMELFKNGRSPLCIVDFAHTPDGLQKAITAAREHTAGSLIVVCGCGGDRDTGKRPAMGRIATTLADRVVFTNDNPRTEDPEKIMKQIIDGVERNNFEVEYDRRTAISGAITAATDRDLVLIAGKGHENYQIIGTVKHHYSDQEVVKEVIAGL